MKKLEFQRVPHTGLPHVEAVYRAVVDGGSVLIVDGSRAGESCALFVPAGADTVAVKAAPVEIVEPPKAPPKAKAAPKPRARKVKAKGKGK